MEPEKILRRLAVQFLEKSVAHISLNKRRDSEAQDEEDNTEREDVSLTASVLILATDLRCHVVLGTVANCEKFVDWLYESEVAYLQVELGVD